MDKENVTNSKNLKRIYLTFGSLFVYLKSSLYFILEGFLLNTILLQIEAIFIGHCFYLIYLITNEWQLYLCLCLMSYI